MFFYKRNDSFSRKLYVILEVLVATLALLLLRLLLFI